MDFSRYRALRRVPAAAAVALCLAAPAHADGNPGYDRPGLGFTPAVLQAGDVTWEQGLPDWSRSGDGSSQYTADTLLRLGLGGPFEVQLGTSYNRLDLHGRHDDGRGESSLGLKFALPASGTVSWGLLASATFTDGAPAFRDDRRSYLLGTAISWQRTARNAPGAYVENVRSGGRDSHLVALNDSYALTPALNGYIEAAWQHDAGTGAGSMAGAGLAWQATSRIQLDGSVRHRLGGRADTWEAGLGLSVYFGR